MFLCPLCYSGLLPLVFRVVLLLTRYPGTFTMTPSPLIPSPVILYLFSRSSEPSDDCSLLSPSSFAPPPQFLCLPGRAEPALRWAVILHPHCASLCGSHVPGRSSIFPPGYSMVLPAFAEAETAAGRELCQAPRLPCQKEALDPLPPVSSPLGQPPSLRLLEGGSPIGQMQTWGKTESPQPLSSGLGTF